jgi:uncharacterized cupin superfamily protein
MRKVTIDEVDSELSPLGVHSERKPVSKALGTEDVAMNYLELEPGDSFSGSLHTHHDQEEIFYILAGTATFDVATEPSTDAVESVTVEAGDAIRFPPGEFQEGYNEGDERVVGLAIGAPSSRHEWDEIESVVHCPDCEEETGHGLWIDDDGTFEMTCNDCGTVVTMGPE